LNNTIHVLIPAYNESGKIEGVINGLEGLGYALRIIVVDDGSKDDTMLKAKKSGAIVVRHRINMGQWASLKTAFAIASLDNASYIVTLDADGQHSTENFDTILKPVLRGEADLVIGSRFRNSIAPEMPKHRLYGIKFFNWIINMRTGLNLTDCTCGYKAYNRKLVDLLLPHIEENQYGALESIIIASRNGAKILERPVININSVKSSKGRLRYAYNLLRTVLKTIFI
jgi:glycosyltransferase involved in cell wall biosynthesis